MEIIRKAKNIVESYSKGQPVMCKIRTSDVDLIGIPFKISNNYLFVMTKIARKHDIVNINEITDIEIIWLGEYERTTYNEEEEKAVKQFQKNISQAVGCTPEMLGFDRDMIENTFTRTYKKVSVLKRGMKIKSKNNEYIGRITQVNLDYREPYFVCYENGTFNWLRLEDIKSIFIEIEVNL